MTEHVEEGTLQAWLDDELQGTAASDVARHLERCVACRDVAQGLRTLESGTTAHLLPLEEELDLNAARWKVRQQRAARREAEREAERDMVAEAGRGTGREGTAQTGRDRLGSPLNRPAPPRKGWSRRRSVAAAAMLVLVAGGAAALPGSPIRTWIGETMGERRIRRSGPPPWMARPGRGWRSAFGRAGWRSSSGLCGPPLRWRSGSEGRTG